MSSQEVLSLLEKDKGIPVSIFSHDYAPLESLVKFLKENKGMSFHEIAVSLNRDDRTIWKTYDNASKKSKAQFIIKKESYYVPLERLSDTRFSILEITCTYLRQEYSLSVNEISELFNKKAPTIWTVLNRYKKKCAK